MNKLKNTDFTFSPLEINMLIDDTIEFLDHNSKKRKTVKYLSQIMVALVEYRDVKQKVYEESMEQIKNDDEPIESDDVSSESLKQTNKNWRRVQLARKYAIKKEEMKNGLEDDLDNV